MDIAHLRTAQAERAVEIAKMAERLRGNRKNAHRLRFYDAVIALGRAAGTEEAQ